jgi:hypothetical protein
MFGEVALVDHDLAESAPPSAFELSLGIERFVQLLVRDELV